MNRFLSDKVTLVFGGIQMGRDADTGIRDVRISPLEECGEFGSIMRLPTDLQP